MNIGNVIRKYRKEVGLTQEEMANRLGVTTPAVNKWENGNSKPDIELLAPIARLLHISLDTLLSFHENLTPAEIGEIVKQMDRMFEVEEFDTVYEW
ncbi:MAG: helix-turn-helix transcriptional regulator, partial [Eubacteriales bacterium]|nr:helix-turn-helix transcriptional regulator [Eubacteriales bacterium]